MAAPVRTPPFLLDERNGRIFPFDAVLAKHRAMKPHYQPPKQVEPARPMMYHEPALPRPAPQANELEAPAPVAAPVAAPAAAQPEDKKAKAAAKMRERRAAEKAEKVSQLTQPPAQQTDIDDILDGIGDEASE